MSRPRQPSSLSREVVVFVPTALLLLILMAAFNLYLYRDAVDELHRTALEEARSQASELAAELARGPSPNQDRLVRLAPGAAGVRVGTVEGQIVAEAGAPGTIDLTQHVDVERPAPVAWMEPRSPDTSAIAAAAPFRRNGPTLWVQVERSSERLGVFLATKRRILYLNVGVVASLTLLVLLYLRRLLAPYESMLERARQLQPSTLEPSTEGDLDETEFLVRTFERALAALDRRAGALPSAANRDPEGDPDADGDGDDIAVLERTLAPSLESGFLLLDTGGRVLSINALGADLLSTEPPEPGAPLDTFLAPYPELLEKLERTVERGTALQRDEVEIPPAAPGDEARVLGLSAHPLRRDDGVLRGFIVLFADLTEARRDARRAQMSRSLSQLGEIAAGVAHEMRNGLGTLKGYLTLIDHAPEEESVRDYLAEMRAESDHLERVLKDFLSFARPGSARSEPLDVADVVRRTMSDPTRDTARLVLEAEGEAFPVLGDGHLLERALRNLIDNAVRAQSETDPAHPVVVRLMRRDASIVIAVEDTGAGIDPAIRDSLLQPFVSGRPDGVGLGLALAHRIAELHDGALEVGDRPTGGVRAVLRLPVRPEPPVRIDT